MIQGVSNTKKIVDLCEGYIVFNDLIRIEHERAVIYLSNDFFLQFITARND